MGILDRRRAAPAPVRSLTASATRVALDGPTDQLKRQLGKRQDRQALAWQFIRSGDVGEVKQLVRFLGNAMGKLRLFPATMPEGADPDDDPVWVMAEESGISPELARAAVEELERLRARIGGQSAILRMLNMNFESVGECYLVGEAERLPSTNERGETSEGRPEEWSVKSIDELRYKEGRAGPTAYVYEDPDDTSGRPLDPALDTVIRIWDPDPQWGRLADCALFGVLGECRALWLLRKQIRAEARSRAFAGLLLLPNDLAFSKRDPTVDDSGGEAGEDKFLEEMEDAIGAADEDEDAGAVITPALVRGDPDALEKVRHLTLGRGGDATVDTRIFARVEGIARGMNAPVEVVTGHQQTTFANADQVDQDTFEDHLEPRAVFVSDAVTVGYLHPQLLDRGFAEVDVRRVFVWFDASRLVAQPDASAAADSGHDRLLISDAAWRRVKGYSEEDAPDDLEKAERLARKQAEAPAAFARTLAAFDGNGHGPHTNGHGNGHGVLTAAAAPSDIGRRLLDVDRELRTRLLVLADRTLERALERAGARFRSAATGKLGTEARKVDPLLACATLGREAVTAAVGEEELLAGAFDAMEESFMRWGATAQRSALDVATRVIGKLGRADRDRLGLRQAQDLAEAWAWARSALESLALARLFDPDPLADALGEIDATGGRVPPGLIRQAMARAGGAVGLETSGEGDAWLAIVNGGTRPAGGIATGDLVRDTLVDNGARLEGYRWVYGPALRQRPFEPHLRLDGVTFANFDDPVLANDEGFPSTSFFMPGDHAGCSCDAEPTWIGP